MSWKEQVVLSVYLSLASWVGKGYIFVSQQKTLTLARKWHHTSFSVRTLNRVLRRLENGGYIQRLSRHHRGIKGELICVSTLSFLKGRAWNWAVDLGRFSQKVFSRCRLPKLAEYRHSTADHLVRCGKVQSLVTQILQKGGPPGTLLDPEPG